MNNIYAKKKEGRMGLFGGGTGDGSGCFFTL